MRTTEADRPSPDVAGTAGGLDEISRLRMAVMRLARRLRQHASAGITPSQQSALAMIAHCGPVSLGELANLENVRPPSMSRIVAALEDEGLVTRNVDETDRRMALVEATPEALVELDRIRRERNEWLADHVAQLDPDEQRTVIDALDALERLVALEDPT